MGKEERRRRFFKEALIKRILVKVGSGVIAAPQGGLNEKKVQDIVEEIVYLRNKGYEVILVSSGAIACGMAVLGISKRPGEIPLKQALASLGQAHLIRTYEKYFNRYGVYVGQVLLTRDDVESRRRFLNARNTIEALLNLGVVPIINENDAVMVEEIKFGDNDRLSALVAIMMDVDLVIMLSTVSGLYTKDPTKSEDAKLIKVVDCGGQELFVCDINGKSFWGTGGMESKLLSIKQLSASGIPAIIAKGERGVLKRIIEGEEVGTFFFPSERKISARKRWIAFATHPGGKIHIDEGAYIALVKRGKSLLPSGIVDVEGDFGMGDVVSVVYNGKEIARGLVNYSSDEIRRIKGCKSSEIEAILGYKQKDEVIHRDDMVISEGLEFSKVMGGGER